MNNRPHYSFRAHTSDWGALADTTGNPARFAADNIPTEPGALDSELAVLHFNSARPGERLKIIERKPRRALSLAADPPSEMWHQPAHRAAVSAPRAQHETTHAPADPPLMRFLYWAGTLIAFAGMGVMLAYRG